MKRPAYVMDWKKKNAEDMKHNPGLRALIKQLPVNTFVVFSDMTAMTNDEVQDISDNGVMMLGR